MNLLNNSGECKVELDAYHQECKSLHNLIESTLVNHQQNYAAGSSVSIADFVLACYIRNHLLNPTSAVSSSMQDELDATPHFQNYINGFATNHLDSDATKRDSMQTEIN